MSLRSKFIFSSYFHGCGSCATGSRTGRVFLLLIPPLCTSKRVCICVVTAAIRFTFPWATLFSELSDVCSSVIHVSLHLPDLLVGFKLRLFLCTCISLSAQFFPVSKISVVKVNHNMILSCSLLLYSQHHLSI